MMKKDKPWAGRFSEETDKQVENFTASIHTDKRLYIHDIEGSIAHARMLARQRIISNKDGVKIIKALNSIMDDIDRGNFKFSDADEDIHMAVEKALIKRIGETGGKLHTARSRNDQVVLDVRLYLREQIEHIIKILQKLKGTFLRLAEREIDTVMPGYTHLQRAQPVLLAHYLMAFWEMLDRDEARLKQCLIRTNIMPLGACAIAGTGLPIDREYTAKLLKFPCITENSMDSVSDRDFVIEFISAASIAMMHLSRFSEDIVIWSTEEFNFIEIDDAFTTGSSIMPQKKNPDVVELIRGRTARVYGNLMMILTLMKGLPMTYNRDLQEDKGPLFDTVDVITSSLQIINAMLMRVKFNRKKMLADASGGFSTATDIADYLVMKGVPFRSAHEVVGKLVSYCIKNGKTFDTLTLNEYRFFHAKFGGDVYKYLTVEGSVNSRLIPGGTSKTAIFKRIKNIKRKGKAIRRAT